jgi:hypothetical protein
MIQNKMSYSNIIDLINSLCKKEEPFPKRVEELINEIGELNVSELSYLLKMTGAIPERYAHDSSEEKLYAKYCDFLVFKFFELLGMESRLCEERGDYADVIGKTKEYIIVADAKAFRLSRTALNPKDYKIEALNGWRKKANGNYACLVAPINEFPKGKSRLYIEAVRFNILMISYTHLIFILSLKNYKDINLSSLWDINKLFENPILVDSNKYWNTIENELLKITNTKIEELNKFKEEARDISLKNINTEIKYLNSIVESIKEMSENEVRKHLLDKLGITKKIIQIQRKQTFLKK